MFVGLQAHLTELTYQSPLNQETCLNRTSLSGEGHLSQPFCKHVFYTHESLWKSQRYQQILEQAL